MRNLFISAGHFPQAKGARVNGIDEYDLNMRFANARTNGVLVPSLSLKEKIAWVNERCQSDDIAIEYHCNTNGFPSKRGTEVYYYGEENRKLADRLDQAIKARLGTLAYGKKGKAIELGGFAEPECLGSIHPDSESFVGSLGWCRNLKCKSVIVEIEYMSNKEGMALLLAPDTPKRVAEAVDMVISGTEPNRNKIEDLIKSLQEQVVLLRKKLASLLVNKNK